MTPKLDDGSSSKAKSGGAAPKPGGETALKPGVEGPPKAGGDGGEAIKSDPGANPSCGVAVTKPEASVAAAKSGGGTGAASS